MPLIYRYILVASTAALCGIATTVTWLESNTRQPSTALTITGNAESTLAIKPTMDTSKQRLLQQQLLEQQEYNGALEYEIEMLEALLSNAPQVANKRKPPLAQELWFDEQTLETLEVDSYLIEDIKQRHNQAELEKLYLRNDISRGDPSKRRNIYQAMQKIDKNLKQELGDIGYDLMLYATGRNNRVAVSDVLATSPAAIAGVEKGDIIISYAGTRVFDPSTLYKGTIQGEMGSNVMVEVQRGDEVINIYIPRGPLGTRFKPSKGKPL
ncbi:MAG: C-terminal processing protease CtpA/Prc [Oceanicoccus sp.]|jgi:C-terminal processing protease CtpA/Prc